MNKNIGHKILFLDFRPQFIEIASNILDIPISICPKEEDYNIVAIDESGCVMDIKSLKAEFVLCPHTAPCRGKINCKNIISCGMSLKSTFGLSSTDNKRSMFSVNRAINLGDNIILPFEEPFKPDSRLSLYENIIIQGIEKLMKPSSLKNFV